MPAKQSNEQWIDKCKKVHGNKYDYSKTDFQYRDEKGRVEIICPIHGVFKQKPANHVHLKQGCPKCNGGVKLTTEEFIDKSKKIFGENRFIYDKVVYVNEYTPITLICPIHGEFSVIPTNHLNHSLYANCPFCGNKIHIKSIFKELKSKFDDILHTVYGYRFNKKDKRYYIQINCKIHGNFEIRLDHMFTRKICICDKCELMYNQQIKEVENAIHKEETDIKCLDRYSFIWKSIQKYGYNKFGYTKVNFVDVNTDVLLLCQIHNEYFEVRPRLHLSERGYDCPICSKKALVKNTEDWIKRKVPEHLLHLYDFSEAEYIDKNTPVKLICPKHGVFWRYPNAIQEGTCICMECTKSSYENMIKYLLLSNNIEYTPQQRFSWLGKQSLDFYINEANIAIECQGSQHFVPIVKFGGEDNFKLTQERDQHKKRLCKENGVNLIYYLDKRFNSYMEEDDIYFNKKEDLLKYIQLKLDNIIEK